MDIDIHSIPESVIVDAAKKVQSKRGYFTVTDLYFELFPITKNTIHQVKNRKNGRYLASVVMSAGAQNMSMRAGQGKNQIYSFPKKYYRR